LKDNLFNLFKFVWFEAQFNITLSLKVHWLSEYPWALCSHPHTNSWVLAQKSLLFSRLFNHLISTSVIDFCTMLEDQLLWRNSDLCTQEMWRLCMLRLSELLWELGDVVHLVVGMLFSMCSMTYYVFFTWHGCWTQYTLLIYHTACWYQFKHLTQVHLQLIKYMRQNFMVATNHPLWRHYKKESPWNSKVLPMV
jgi:hypothetical protein